MPHPNIHPSTTPKMKIPKSVRPSIQPSIHPPTFLHGFRIRSRIRLNLSPTSTLSHAMGPPTRSGSGCNPVKKPGPVMMDHMLLALRETPEEKELRIRSLFAFFDVAGKGFLDCAQIESGLSSLCIPEEYKYARDLLNVCNAVSDGRVGYEEFRKYMDAKELELYRIFQAIDVEHNGCILPEELWVALVKAGCASLGKLLDPQDCVAHVLPVIVNFSQDESWRVCHMVANQLYELC